MWIQVSAEYSTVTYTMPSLIKYVSQSVYRHWVSWFKWQLSQYSLTTLTVEREYVLFRTMKIWPMAAQAWKTHISYWLQPTIWINNKRKRKHIEWTSELTTGKKSDQWVSSFLLILLPLSMSLGWTPATHWATDS